MLTYVVAQCDVPQLDTEVEYMMELLDPSLLQGEGRFCFRCQNVWSWDADGVIFVTKNNGFQTSKTVQKHMLCCFPTFKALGELITTFVSRFVKIESKRRQNKQWGSYHNDLGNILPYFELHNIKCFLCEVRQLIVVLRLILYLFQPDVKHTHWKSLKRKGWTVFQWEENGSS